MSNKQLAILGSGFLAVSTLVVSFLVPAFAQVTPESPARKTEIAAVGPVNPQSPNPSIATEEMARLYLVRKQYREAEEIFHQLTQQEPKNAVYWNELGITLHSQAELALALKCYQKSAKLDSHYSDALNNQGTIYYERRKYAKAVRAYKRAIGLRGDYASFYLNLGYAYFGQRQYEDSILAFRKALELDPQAFDSSRSHAGTIIQDRSIGSDRGRFYFLLAKSFAQAGNLDRCIAYLKKAHDEGYAEMRLVKTDPAFASVVKNPDVQELLAPKPADSTTPGEATPQ